MAIYFTGADLVLFAIAFFIPPLVMVFKQGCGCELLICLCLTLLGHIPGVVYAWWVIYSNCEDPLAYRPLHNNSRPPLRPQTSSQRRTYCEVAASPPPNGTLPEAGVIHHYNSTKSQSLSKK
ncbi:hypothetical protein BCR41DRAFT_345805 [Lobosporangium transversale]|uniref:Uncharacterized protein n=1 Tax=Lobosporangium transversale TaxID=64571 RepID=A0A1Y2GZP1_9FUNG|nr:hypothetical protein BCR41DRAFT_345805 [Lobosporangium transversale]ORZ27736.1 hypothetical protein BCR41DRAFT_345805 [Lobosporangium transversale]|eukprot:XP_021885439.1 hypothetical protein BCR41DRAFT_345805 [Lobosporangium transversale]